MAKTLSTSERERCAKPMRALDALCGVGGHFPPQVPSEFSHLLTPEALWGMYVEDREAPVAELPARAMESEMLPGNSG